MNRLCAGRRFQANASWRGAPQLQGLPPSNHTDQHNIYKMIYIYIHICILIYIYIYTVFLIKYKFYLNALYIITHTYVYRYRGLRSYQYQHACEWQNPTVPCETATSLVSVDCDPMLPKEIHMLFSHVLPS